MKNFIDHERRRRWLLLLIVFLLGLLAGVVIAQTWTRNTTGDWLGVTAMIVIGLGARARRPTQNEPVPGAARSRIELMRGDGTWIVRGHDILGRESLEFAVGLNNAGTLGVLLGATRSPIVMMRRTCTFLTWHSANTTRVCQLRRVPLVRRVLRVRTLHCRVAQPRRASR
jgi:hypothetical protein